MTTLFDSLRLGALDLPQRILMAPMTRARGTCDHMPSDMMVEYYRQRAPVSSFPKPSVSANKVSDGLMRQASGWTNRSPDGAR
jgi:N-ethylmaleimide reductase